ncbi:MAG: hypothetical protein ACC661_09485, partial [Verrucomicrobiales bacterium]
ILTLDLASNLGANAFVDDGTSHVVQTELGAYREAGPEKFSRFAARVALRRTGLHLVRVTYPDDKARTCEISSTSPEESDRFNIHSGYFTGDDFPLSGRLQTAEFVMWARHRDQALVFTSWLEDEPAAASRIEVYEIEGRLPAHHARQNGKMPDRRWIGHYWEDAQPLSRCFGGDAPELADFDRVVKNLCDYFDYTDQNLLMHPVVWYEGPIYNSLVESRGGKGGFHLPVNGWMDILLNRFEERGFKFYGLFNVHQLPSLMREMNADLEGIKKGEPTFNTVSRENEVYIKTFHHRLSMINALHPRVQQRVLALVEELTQRYGSYTAFGGIGFHVTLAQLLAPGSLEVSYDDWTINAFEEDTGIRVPVDRADPERFSKRYAWLMENARARWISWRCERLAAFYGEVARVLRQPARDLELVVTLLEPPMSIIDPQREAWRNGKSLVELAREGGIDPKLLSRIPNLVIQQRLGPTAKKKRQSFGTTRGRWGSPPPTPESIEAVRQMDFSEQQQREFKRKDHFGVFLYNRYFESNVGERKPLSSTWFRSIPWRASAVVPAHRNFMEYYAHSLAMLDPGLIAIGGFTNGTAGHEKDVADFASVYRALPADGSWKEIVGLGEGVLGRFGEIEGQPGCYLINRTPEKVRVIVPEKFWRHATRGIGNSPPFKLTEKGAIIELEAYQLGAWFAPDARKRP